MATLRTATVKVKILQLSEVTSYRKELIHGYGVLVLSTRRDDPPTTIPKRGLEVSSDFGVSPVVRLEKNRRRVAISTDYSV